MTPKRRDGITEGLARGVERADIAGMADTVGKGLKRVSVRRLGRGLGDGLERIWPSRGQFVIPQPCPIEGCDMGPYGSTRALTTHLQGHHAGLRDDERSEFCESARRQSAQQAMNGTGP